MEKVKTWSKNGWDLGWWLGTPKMPVKSSLMRLQWVSAVNSSEKDRRGLEAARELLLDEGLDRITVGQGDWIVPQVGWMKLAWDDM